ncbi:hypothetical protein [Parasedimentitalea psychrophila]|uniref:Uncharacterized protein n=1 Tax=Parasedimentitalea psychrophila TaxID=2997337 RepID=A0A9Y2P1W0_9RHOB|nr:hypothetical protein [Parasedimentitalea psychrophila]WIY26011.1 hypothetical protein QPJ95_03520 [Parasedimentitalea psychrophila]
MVFLVGGAGNGKSYLAARVVRDSEARKRGAVTRFAQRTYMYSTPAGSSLRVVNDATIPADGESRIALFDDIRTVIKTEENLLVCANRGVLVGELRELAALELDATGNVAHGLISLLFELNFDSEKLFEGWRLEPDDIVSSDYKSFRMRAPTGREIDVHIVFMDHVSLLEPLPKSSSPDCDQEQPPVASILQDNGSYKPRNAAFELPLKEVAEKFLEDSGSNWPGGDLDPIRANAEMLSREEVVDSWCRCVRGAEIVGGFNFSYRDLWGLASLALIGPSPDGGTAQLAELLRRHSEDVEQARNKKEKCKALVELANYRCHVNLFGGLKAALPLGVASQPLVYVQNDAMSAMASADPLQDVSRAASCDLAGVMVQVIDGHSSADEFTKVHPRLLAAWSPLDDALDSAVSKLVDPMNSDHVEIDRIGLLSWYSQYLLRFYGLALGKPAFLGVLGEYQRCLKRGLRNENLAKNISDALLRVFLPPSGEDARGTARLPVMKPRVTTPASGDAHIAIEVDPLDFKIGLSVVGGRMLLKIHRRDSGDAAETTLDFHLMREALSRVDGAGFTDSLRHVEPRLERLRARVLSLESKANPRLGGNTIFVCTDGHVIRPR